MEQSSQNRRREAVPTRAQLWQEVCMMRQDFNELIAESHRIVAQNTLALQELRNSIDKMCSLTMQSSAGVPVKVFLLVVATLLIVIISIAGISLSDVANFIR